MKWHRYQAALALLCGVTFVPLCASAAPITFFLTGAVTQTNFDPGDPFGGTVVFGSPVGGALTFDGASVDRIPDPQQGSFVSLGPPFGVHLLIGDVPLDLEDFIAINTLHARVSQDGVLACSDGPVCQGLVFSVLLNDPTGRAMTSDALPLTSPDLRQFEPAAFRLSGTFAGSQIEIEGSVATLSEASGVAAPEPGTVGLCWAALVFAASFGRVKERLR